MNSKNDYLHAALSLATAQICQSLGWHSIHRSSHEILIDILERYIKQVSKTAASYCQNCKITQFFVYWYYFFPWKIEAFFGYSWCNVYSRPSPSPSHLLYIIWTNSFLNIDQNQRKPTNLQSEKIIVPDKQFFGAW